MRPSQLHTLERITLEAATEARERLIWFYRDVVELEPRALEESDRLRFCSAQLELIIELKPTPKTEPVARRALISVRSVSATAEMLERERMAFQSISGMQWSDQRLSLVDPGGNRIELKQEWRPGVFSEDRRTLPTEPDETPGGDKKNVPGR